MITWRENKEKDLFAGITFFGFTRYEAKVIMLEGFFYPGVVKYGFFSKKVIWRRYFTKHKSITREKAYKKLREIVLELPK